MEVSEAVELLGNPGKYGIILYICLWLCNSTVAINHVIMAVFGYTPAHRCAIPSSLAENPNVEIKRTQCSFAAVPFAFSNYTVNETIYCPNGWEFRMHGSESTIVNEWNLVCDEKYLVGLSTTIYFAGVMVGGSLFGQLADMFGRKPVLLITLYGHIAVGLGVAFSPSFAAFTALRFFLGVLVQGLQTSSYVLLIEMTQLKHRPLTAGLFEVFWALGTLWMAFLAWLVQDWRKIQLVLCLPSLVTIFYIIFVPESVRWLVNRGEIAKAEEIIKKMARFNKKTLPDNLGLYVNTLVCNKKPSDYSCLDLFKTKQMFKRTVLMGYIWLACSVGYYGLTLGAKALPGNRYTNLFISSAVELPGFASVIFTLRRFGRRVPLMIYFAVGGILCVTAGCIPSTTSSGQDLSYLPTLLALLGKFFIATAFATIFLFTVELFPTIVRTIGMGSCVFWARVGGMISPQILLLGKSSFAELPFLIFGCAAVLASVATYFIPETRGIKLPDTIEEVEGHSADATLLRNRAFHDIEMM